MLPTKTLNPSGRIFLGNCCVFLLVNSPAINSQNQLRIYLKKIATQHKIEPLANPRAERCFCLRVRDAQASNRKAKTASPGPKAFCVSKKTEGKSLPIITPSATQKNICLKHLSPQTTKYISCKPPR